MGQAERFHEDAVVAGEAAAKYHSRGVPSDWYVDPAEPESAGRYIQAIPEGSPGGEPKLRGDSEQDNELHDLPMGPRRLTAGATEPVWMGLPSSQDLDNDGELGWQTDSLCAQTDPEAFFPEKGGSTRDAKKVCGSCNVRSQCLEYALANDERFGIWGGLSERERRRLRKRAV